MRFVAATGNGIAFFTMRLPKVIFFSNFMGPGFSISPYIDIHFISSPNANCGDTVKSIKSSVSLIIFSEILWLKLIVSRAIVKKLAKLFKNGDITPVRIPPELDEAVRDVCRARTDAVDDLCRAKQRLNSFLLRHGFRYSGKSRWTPAHMRYLRTLTMPTDIQKIVLEDYIQAIDKNESRVAELKSKLIDLLKDWEWKPIVEALMGCKGFQEVAAMTVVSELGDLRRFDNPRKLMAFLGLVPSEHSSGGTRRQGAITKCGNSHARWMLIECAQHFRKPPQISAALTTRQIGLTTEVKELSWRMQNRLHDRYVKLKMRKKNENKCIVAVARELVAFIWELQNKCNLEMPTESEVKNMTEN